VKFDGAGSFSTCTCESSGAADDGLLDVKELRVAVSCRESDVAMAARVASGGVKAKPLG
jgi:hypothetical protein